MNDIWNRFKKAGCKSNMYCGEFRLRDVLTTLDPVIQTVGSFCARITNLGLGDVQIDAFNDWGLRSLTANPWARRNAPSLLDMLSRKAPWGLPGSLLNNTTNGPMHVQRFWYHWTDKSPCCEHWYNRGNK